MASSHSQELLKRGTALHRAGQLRQAASLYEQVIATEPGNWQVLHLLGTVYTRLKDYTAAIRYLRKANELRPESAEVLNALGLALFPAGRREEALAAFERALAIDPSNAKAANNIGNAHFNMKSLGPARTAFETALQIRPDYLEARSNLGHCLAIGGDADGAIQQFEIVLNQNPGYRHAIEGLITAYKTLARDDDVVAQRRTLVDLDPRNPALWVELGVSLQAIDKYAEAIECFRKALEIERNFAAAHARIGWAQMERGKLEEARHSFLEACRLEPNSCLFRSLLVRVTRVARGDGTIEALESMLPHEDDLPTTERVYLHFALGKAYADIDANEASFDHYLKANRLRRAQIKYDERSALRRMERTGELFSPAILTRCAGEGNPTELPIFILGMPRTGSTLVEQIIAGHPQVVAAGEVTAFRDAVQAMDARKGSAFPEWLPAMTGDDARALGDAYIHRLVQTAKNRDPSPDLETITRITDKLPGNCQLLGLIHLALPNARFIHTIRDPIQTCLSCFRVDFESLNFTSDLGELGRYYRCHERLMQTWRAVLPANLILDVQYEALVADLDNVARQIISHCGLDWDDACLDFEGVDRPVRTASSTQVRKPLYMTSVRSWRPNDDVLKPLLEGLDLPNQ